MKSYEDVFGRKKRILFVTAHPDDVDVFFGGTIARLKNDGKEIFVLLVTNGARGSKHQNISEAYLAKTRIKEQLQALGIYGIKQGNFKTLNYKDGEAEADLRLIEQIVYMIRKFKPDIVCTHNPHSYYSQNRNQDTYEVNHKDHRVCATATLDAVYPFSRDSNFFKEHVKIGLAPHTVTDLFFTENGECNAQIDITKFINLKKQTLRAHKSQFDNKIIDKIISISENGNGYFEYGYHIKLRE